MKAFKIAILIVLGVVLAAGIAVGLLLWPAHAGNRHKATGTVVIKQTPEGYQLYRNGQPYTIKGASLVDIQMLKTIKAAGGNSIRLYDTYNAGAILDSAHKLGLTVTLGLKLKQARRELDYADEEGVARQLAELKKEVLKYKDHPALLMWAVGNETTLFITPYYRNFLQLRPVFKAVDAIAHMVHEVDPNHPTTMMLANINKPLIRMVSLVCRDIDLLSFNVFGPLQQKIPEIATSGWRGPFLISEFGARGYWTAPHTDWYSRLEVSSYYKAQYLESQYQTLAAHRNQCLGSYVFLWGTKQEYTATWFSLFANWKGVQPTELSDACTEAWLGQKPDNPAPSINYLLINGKSDEHNIYLPPGTGAELELHTLRTETGPLHVKWELHEENPEYLNSSYKQHKPKILGGDTLYWNKDVVAAGLNDEHGGRVYRFRFMPPGYQGAFRLYVYLMHENGKVATANASFFVHAQ